MDRNPLKQREGGQFSEDHKILLAKGGGGEHGEGMNWKQRINQSVRGETRAFIRARLNPAQNLNLSALVRSGALR